MFDRISTGVTSFTLKNRFVKQYFPDAYVSFVFTEPCRLNRFFNLQ